MMRRILAIVVLLLLSGSCSQKPKPVPPAEANHPPSATQLRPLITQLPPPLESKLLTYTSTIQRIAEEKVLTVGQSCVPCPESPIRVRLDRIDLKKKKCLLQVEDVETGHKVSGWSRQGRYVSFAPAEVGTGGLEVSKIAPEEVTLTFYSCRYITQVDGQEVDELTGEVVRSPAPQPCASQPVEAASVRPTESAP